MPLDRKQTKNVFADNHENDVANPDDVPTEYQTNDTGNDLSVAKARNESQYPRSNGDNCKDYANDVRKSEVIALCHGSNSFLVFFVFSLYYLYAGVSSIFPNFVISILIIEFSAISPRPLRRGSL